jgi:hypothetical protein
LRAVSDPVKLAVITLLGSFVTVVGGIVSAWIGYLMLRAKLAKAIETEAPKIVAPITAAVETGNSVQRDAAVEVRDVKATLIENTQKTGAQLDDQGIAIGAILHLVNSGTAANLRLRVQEAHSRLTEHDTEANRTLLAAAERELAEHMAKQATADAAAGGAEKIVAAGRAISRTAGG